MTSESSAPAPVPPPAPEPRPVRADLALRAAGLGAWEWSPASGELRLDASAETLLGTSAGGTAGVRKVLRAVRREDRRALVDAALAADAGGVLDVEVRARGAGPERRLHVCGRLVASAGEAPRLAGTLGDATAAHAERERAAERDERLRAALYASRTGTFRWDIRTSALDWDENLDRLFGLPPGRTVRSLEGFVACVHPEDRARVIAACGRCAAEGADFDEEFRVLWPDGSLHWLDDKGRTFRDGEGRPWYMTGACVEVTERRRVGEALGESEARLRRIMDSGIVGVFFWSLSGGITDANDKFLEMMGYTRADLAAGRIDWRSMTPPEYAAADAEKVAELTSTGAHGPYEKEYVGAGGLPVPVLVASAMFEGSPDRGVALCIDLTERRRVQRALAERERELRDALAAAEAARAEAEQANQAKSAFLATMSHELRTPLNAIGGYVDLMDLGIRGPVTDAMREDLARIRRSQAHLLGLINDVLNFARLEAGVVRYDLAAVPVREVIAAAEGMVGPQMAARSLAYHPAEADPALLAMADADKLRQVLVNLLSNALKFTDAGGSVRTWCEDAGAEVRIHVADTGRGIAPNRLASIFEPFVQVDRDLATRNEGVGLGLAISRELARGMGGDLTAVSEPGQGSTFTITLVRAPD